MINKKAIAGILVATIALASVAIAVSAEGEGGVGPMSILPGAITSYHIASDAVYGHTAGTAAEIADDTITDDDISDYSIGETSIAPNAINSTQLKANSTLNATTGATLAAVFTKNDTFWHWNATVVPISLSRDAKLIIFYTADDAWGSDAPYNLSVNCTVNSTTTEGFAAAAYPQDVRIADEAYNNLSSTVVFYTDEKITAGTYYVQVQIAQKVGTNGVGVNEPAVTVIALPA